MINILHLSDLHFGDDHDQTATTQRHAALDSMLTILSKLEASERPNIVVISGDLSCKGKAQGYEDLKIWLTDKLFKITELTPADCIICPGNHDVDRDARRGLVKRTADPAEADDLLRPEWLENFSRHFHRYVTFADELNIPHPTLNTKPSPSLADVNSRASSSSASTPPGFVVTARQIAAICGWVRRNSMR